MESVRRGELFSFALMAAWFCVSPNSKLSLKSQNKIIWGPSKQWPLTWHLPLPQQSIELPLRKIKKKKKKQSLSIFQISENPRPDCRLQKQWNLEMETETGGLEKQAVRSAGQLSASRRVGAGGRHRAFSYKPRTQKPQSLLAEAGPRGTSWQGWS